MSRYLLGQLLSFVVTLWAVLTLVFVGVRALPGDAATIVGGIDTTPTQVRALRHALGLDRSLPQQYATYWSELVRGDLGTSLRQQRPVLAILMQRLPVTASLAGLAFLMSLLLGTALGLLAGLRPGGAADRLALALTTVGLALPEFWFGFLLILLFAVRLAWFPVVGLPAGGVLAALPGMVLPAVTLALPRAAQIARLTRARVLDELSADYVRTARSKGATPARTGRHVAANALPGVVPLLALELGGLLTGTIVVEQVFGIPGLGLGILDAISARDYPVVQGVAILAVTIYVVVNLLADLTQLLADPRLRIS